MSSFQNSLMLARLTMTSTSRLHTAAAAITTPLVTAPQPFFCQMEILNFVPLASKPAVAAGGSRRYTHPEPRRGRCGSSSFLRVGWSGRGPRSMASSPTRSETLRPHFLMAVGLGPAQKHYRRKDGTRRLPGSQPHHLRRERHQRGHQARTRRGPQGPDHGRATPPFNEPDVLRLALPVRLAAADGRRPRRQRPPKASPHPCHEEESRDHGGEAARGACGFDDACAVVLLVADAPSAPPRVNPIR